MCKRLRVESFVHQMTSRFLSRVSRIDEHKHTLIMADQPSYLTAPAASYSASSAGCRSASSSACLRICSLLCLLIVSLLLLPLQYIVLQLTAAGALGYIARRLRVSSASESFGAHHTVAFVLPGHFLGAHVAHCSVQRAAQSHLALTPDYDVPGYLPVAPRYVA